MKQKAASSGIIPKKLVFFVDDQVSKFWAFLFALLTIFGRRLNFHWQFTPPKKKVLTLVKYLLMGALRICLTFSMHLGLLEFAEKLPSNQI